MYYFTESWNYFTEPQMYFSELYCAMEELTVTFLHILEI